MLHKCEQIGLRDGMKLRSVPHHKWVTTLLPFKADYTSIYERSLLMFTCGRTLSHEIILPPWLAPIRKQPEIVVS